MPEQQAWSAVSVWHNLQSPPFTLSPSCFLDLLHFPPLSPLTLSFSLSNCYLSLIFTITAMFTFHFSLTHLFFSLTLLLDHPSPVLLSYLFISFSVHFILCSPYCIAFVGAIISTFCLPALTVLSPELSLTLYPLLLFSKRGGKKVYRKKRKR